MLAFDPQRGDLCEVQWVDVNEEATGDPNKATLAHRVSYGIFWERRIESEIECVVTTTTVDQADYMNQSGFCIYPSQCVKKLIVIRRARKPRTKRSKSSGQTKPQSA